MHKDAAAGATGGPHGGAAARRFANRKLHSLIGVFPLGAFVIEHLFTNSFILGGQNSYDKAVSALLSLPKPILWGLEIVFIALPLAFHGLYGVKIALEGRPNHGAYGYARNRFYTFQRWTAMYLLAFIVYHVWTTRFSGHFTYPATGPVMGGGDAALGTVGMTTELVGSKSSIYYFMLDKLHGDWLVGAVYLLGVAAACFHFANGLWTFCISWGITVGARAQDRARVAFTALGLALGGLGAATVIKLVTTRNPFAG